MKFKKRGNEKKSNDIDNYSKNEKDSKKDDNVIEAVPKKIEIITTNDRTPDKDAGSRISFPPPKSPFDKIQEEKEADELELGGQEELQQDIHSNNDANISKSVSNNIYDTEIT